MTTPVVTVLPLGSPPWPTIDPFLFCVHHRDAYPAGTPALGPDPSLLRGREIGSDFSGRDGWSMYHGSTVPGFPQHPHRGFETVTFVARGLIDHADSLGAAARYGDGDVQWLTAGGGIVHAEMFPLLDDGSGRDGANATEFFQIWVNLPKRSKMAEPYFAMLWAEDVPVRTFTDASGRETVVTIAAGALDGSTPPSPPPDSWASGPENDVAIWRIELDPGAEWTLPAASAGTSRVLYVFGGSGVSIAGRDVSSAHAAQLTESTVALTAGPGGAACLLLQGRPIGEPVVQYGPFVMNDRAGIEQAFHDYQRTGFGGWPWPVDDPTHGSERQRFARRSDGQVERPLPARSTP